VVFTNDPSAQHEQEQPFLPGESANLAAQPMPELVIGSGNSPDPKWAVWLDVFKAFGIWIGSIILLLVTQLAFGIPWYVYRWLTTGPPRIESLTSDKSLAFLAIASVLPAHLLTLGLIWLVVVRGRKGSFRQSLDFEWPRYMNPAFGTMFCTLIAIVLFVIGAVATYRWGGSKTQLDLLVESSIPARMATAFIAVFTAPLIEELIYRGVLYSALQRALGTTITVFVVSLLFAGVHVFQYIDNIAVITVITLLSFTLTLVRANTGSVLAPFVIHLVFNGIQSVIIVLSPFINLGQSS
jgi:membrane protease YdiL (CAAX protease family)